MKIVVGPYLKIKTKQIVFQSLVLSCPNGHLRMGATGRFCTVCGQERVKSEIEQKRNPKLYDILPDDNERLFSANNFMSDDFAPSDVIFACGNDGTVADGSFGIDDDSTPAYEFPRGIGRRMALFGAVYAEEIKAIMESKHVEEATIHFGIVVMGGYDPLGREPVASSHWVNAVSLNIA